MAGAVEVVYISWPLPEAASERTGRQVGPLLRDGAQPSAARIVISTNIILQRCPVWSIHLQGNHSVLVSRSSVFVVKMNLWVLFIVLLQWQLSSAGLPPHAVPLTWPACLATSSPTFHLCFSSAMHPLLSTSVSSKINNPCLLYFYSQTSNLLFLTATQPTFIWVDIPDTITWVWWLFRLLPERLTVLSQLSLEFGHVSSSLPLATFKIQLFCLALAVTFISVSCYYL